MRKLLRDLRFAGRVLMANPIFSAAAVVSLALGIGANTTIFTFVKAVFLNPLPVSDISTLVSVFTTDERNASDVAFGSNLPMSLRNFEDIRDGNDVFQGTMAFTFAAVSVSGSEEPEMLTAQLVTGGYFDVLGIQPTAGRFFGPDQDQVLGANPLAVISHALWQRRFGGDRSAIGQAIRLNRQAFTIVGVAPPGFGGTVVVASTDIWLPSTMHQQVASGPILQYFESRRALLFGVVGRLKPGVGVEAARANISALGESLAERFPGDNQKRGATVEPLSQSVLPSGLQKTVSKSSQVLMTVVALILLIACANVANLLLGRASARRREIAIRISIGASRGRLVRQLLTESVLLALAGGAVGLAIAYWGKGVLWAARPPFLRQASFDLSLDARVLLFTFALSIATGLIFGLMPALQTSKSDVSTTLKAESASLQSAGGLLSLRNVLVVGQVALALVSLIGAGLFLRSLSQARTLDLGYQTDQLVRMTFDLGPAGYEPARGREFFRAAAERAKALPGVETATVAQVGPLTGTFARTVFLPGQDSGGDRNGRLVQVNIVGEDYFQTLEIPLLRGRDFEQSDREGTPLVAIVNQTMAKTFWPDQEAIGQRFLYFGEAEPLEVVGIARDAKYQTVGEPPQPYIYQPYSQSYVGQMSLLLRTSGDPAATLLPVQRQIRALDPNLAVIDASTMRQVIDTSLWAPRLGAQLLSVFGAIALVLAAVGIYGVMAYSVSQSRHEIGLRLALGAPRLRILRTILARGMALAAIGSAIGLFAALALSPRLSSLLWVDSRDPVTYAATVLILAVVSLAANLLPARRAIVIDPILALRSGGVQKG